MQNPMQNPMQAPAPAQQRIDINAIAPGETFCVSGTVAYSKIAHRIEGQELVEDQMRRQQNGLQPIDKPYTSITLNNARVEYRNPAAPTLAEQYAEQRLYDPKGQNAQGKAFSPISKSRNIPAVIQLEADGKTGKQIVLDDELGRGMHVKVFCKIFATRLNNGCGIDSVLLLEPLRHSGSNLDYLAQLGYVIEPPTIAPAPAPAAEAAPEQAPAPVVEVPQTYPQPAAAPQPAPQPYPAPQAYPAPQNYQQPVAAPQPAPQPYPAPQPVQGMDSYVPPTYGPAGATSGIQFDPTKRYGD